MIDGTCAAVCGLRQLDVALIAEFDEHLRRSGKTPTFRRQTRDALRRFARHLDARGLMEARNDDLKSWRAACLSTANPDTVAKYLGEVIAFYRWLHAKQLIPKNPANGLLKFGPRPVDDQTEQLLAEFNLAQRRRNLSPLTKLHRESRLRDLALTVAPKSLLEITADDIETYLDDSDIAAQTRYTYLSYLRAFYAWAKRKGHVRENPIDDCERPQYARWLPRPMSDDDLALALEQADDRMAVWIALAAFAGLRCMEIAGLRVEDLYFHDDPRRLVVLGKGNKQRAVPMHPEVIRRLHAYGLPPSGYVFARRSSRQPLNPSTVSRYVGRHLEELGIHGQGAHSMRHWFGTRTYGASRDLRMVQDLMGHANPATTAGYAKVSTADAARTVDSLSVRSRA
jgi:site-specific recombinase XerD